MSTKKDQKDKPPKNTPKKRDTKPKIPKNKEILPKKQEIPQKQPETIENNNSLTLYDTAIDKILQDNSLPETIEPIQNKRSKYTKVLALKILIEIATNGKDTISAICHRNGIEANTLSLWSLYSEDLYASLHRAKEMRQDARIDSIESQETALQAIVSNPDIDVREKHVQIQYHRVTTMNKQWLAARLNKRYQEKSQQETTITIDHADLRAQAWDNSTLSKAKEVPYKDVSPDSTQVSSNEDTETRQ